MRYSWPSRNSTWFDTNLGKVRSCKWGNKLANPSVVMLESMLTMESWTKVFCTWKISGACTPWTCMQSIFQFTLVTASLVNILTFALVSFAPSCFANAVVHTNLRTLVKVCPSTGWHKTTVITKNQITSKILIRLTQNFSYIRSSLCSRHLQSFKSVLQKLFVSLALKKCAPNELPGAAGTFGSGGQSSRWPSHFPPLGSLLLLLWLLPSGQG